MFRIAMPRAKKHPKLSNEGLSIGVPSEQSDRWGRPRAHGSLHHAQTPAVLDHSRALPQGDGSAGPAFARGAVRCERNLIVLDASDVLHNAVACVVSDVTRKAKLSPKTRN